MYYHRAVLVLAAAALTGLTLVPRTSPIDTAIASTGPGKATSSAIEESNFVPPKPIADKMVFPTYPEEYRSEGATGLVLLSVKISDRGIVTSAEEKQGVSGHPAQCPPTSTGKYLSPKMARKRTSISGIMSASSTST